MTEEERRARNSEMLLECHEVFRADAAVLIATLEVYGERPRIQCAWRSVAEQLRLYEAGRSKVRWGYHNASSPRGGPEALAIDVIDERDPDEEHGTDTHFYRLMRREATRLGLDNSIAWDPYHVQVAGLTLAEARRGRRPTRSRTHGG